MTRSQRPTSEHIADTLIADIRSGRLNPGDRIREQEVAERFSVSRGPVREALMKLTSQHWVAHEPGKGVRVIHADTKHDPDAIVIGQALSQIMASFATTRSTDAELAELEQRVQSLSRLAREGCSTEVYSEASWELGRFVLRIARSPLLSQFIESFQYGALPYISLGGVATQRQRIGDARLWVDLLIAMQRRIPDHAAKIMLAMLERSAQERMRSAVDPVLFEFGWNPGP